MIKKSRVMIVDDSKLIRTSLGKEISDYGYDVTLVESGTECLTNLSAEKFDLILLDINMPDMNGFEVIEKIRLSKNREVSDIPVILLTSSDKHEDKTRGFSVGANDFFSKENETTDVLKSIDLLLNPAKEYEGFKVLLVEDKDSNRKFLCALLKAEGFDIIEASDGKIAFEIFKQNEEVFDLIITDDIMPSMNGLELTKAIREYTSRQIPILALTAYKDDNKIHEFISAKANDLILKPITRELFKTKISTNMRSYLFGKLMGAHPISNFKEISSRQSKSKSGTKDGLIGSFIRDMTASKLKLQQASDMTNQFIKEIEGGQDKTIKKDAVNHQLVRELEQKQDNLKSSTDVLTRMIDELENYQEEMISAKDIFKSIYEQLNKLKTIISDNNIEIPDSDFNTILIGLISDLDALRDEFGTPTI